MAGRRQAAPIATEVRGSIRCAAGEDGRGACGEARRSREGDPVGIRRVRPATAADPNLAAASVGAGNRPRPSEAGPATRRCSRGDAVADPLRVSDPSGEHREPGGDHAGCKEAGPAEPGGDLMISGRHAVLFLAYNQLELTKAALASVAAQDCGPLEIFGVNNGSTDGTAEWLVDFQTFADARQVRLFHYLQNESPVAQTNRFLGQIFRLGHERVLMVPNDVVLPPNAYREMDRWPRGIVAASPTDQKEFPRVE